MDVRKEIMEFISRKERNGALLLTGKWGCGKTYLIRQVRDELNKDIQYAVVIVLYIRQILSGARQPTGAWPERFFYSNMAIVGFGLDQCEADIWWLLSYRAFLYYTNSWNMRDLIRNNIVYYRIIDRRSNKDTESSNDIKPSLRNNIRKSSNKRDNSIWYIDDQDLTEEEKRFNRLLRSEHIGVNMYVLRDGVTYEEAYRQILLDIDNKGIREYHCNNVELSCV